MGKSQETPETAAEKANAEVAMEQWQMYQDNYRPTEQKFFADVMRDQTGMKQVVSGKVNADMAQVKPHITDPGKDPSRLATSRIFDQVANTQAKSIADAVQSVDDKQISGMQAIVDLGQGKSATAQSGFANLASQSVSEAISKTQADRQKSDSYSSAAMTALGGAARVGQDYWGGSGGFDTSVESMVNPMAKYSDNPALPGDAWAQFSKKYGQQ
jgi:hypothetical protein